MEAGCAPRSRASGCASSSTTQDVPWGKLTRVGRSLLSGENFVEAARRAALSAIRRPEPN